MMPYSILFHRWLQQGVFEEIVDQYGIGCAANLDDKSCADKLYDWYKAIDRSKFSENCKHYADEILDDMDNLKKHTLII